MEEVNDQGFVKEETVINYNAKRPRLSDNINDESKGRRLHPVWEHFTVLDKSTMECLICLRKFKTTSSTTVCKHHLKSKHPELYAQLADEQKDWRNRTFAPDFNGNILENSITTYQKNLQNYINVIDLLDEEKFFIIKSVKDRPALWNVNHEVYNISAFTDKLFTEIAQEVSIKWRVVSGDEIQHIWNNLKMAYEATKMEPKNIYKVQNDEKDEKTRILKSKFLDEMSFLDTSSSTALKSDISTRQFSEHKNAKTQAHLSNENFDAITNFISPLPISFFSQNQHLRTQKLASSIDPSINLTGNFSQSNGLLSPSINSLEENRDESTPLGFLVIDLHRKLRQKKKLEKALQFKKCLFNLISDYEQEVL